MRQFLAPHHAIRWIFLSVRLTTVCGRTHNFNRQACQHDNRNRLGFGFSGGHSPFAGRREVENLSGFLLFRTVLCGCEDPVVGRLVGFSGDEANSSMRAGRRTPQSPLICALAGIESSRIHKTPSTVRARIDTAPRCMRYVSGATRTEPRYTSRPERGGWAKTRTRWCGKNACGFPVQAVKSGQRDATDRLRRHTKAKSLLCCGKASLRSKSHQRHQGSLG